MTETGQIAFTVFLDANVLAKPVTRTLLMAAGAASGYGAVWSAYVESEADRHARPEQRPVSQVRILTDSELTPTGSNAERFAATSPKDRQVLADAVAAEALFLITEDVDDFGHEDLMSAGITAVNPDLFMSIKATPAAYREALGLMVQRFRNPRRSVGQLHERLGRAHPLTARAQAAQFPGEEPLSPTHNAPAELYRGNRCLNCLQTGPSVTLGLCPACAEFE